MTNFEKIKSMNKIDLTNWLDNYGQFDHSPWFDWFDENFCKKCEPIKCKVLALGNKEIECSFCEIENHCRFFKEQIMADNKVIIKLWLDAEA